MAVVLPFDAQRRIADRLQYAHERRSIGLTEFTQIRQLLRESWSVEFVNWLDELLLGSVDPVLEFVNALTTLAGRDPLVEDATVAGNLDVT